MDKYKINYIYNEENDINEIFIKVLNKELKKYILTVCNDKKTLLYTLSQKGGKGVK